MCTFCDRPCWRSGGEYDCDLTDAEFEEAMDEYEGGWGWMPPPGDLDEEPSAKVGKRHNDSEEK